MRTPVGGGRRPLRVLGSSVLLLALVGCSTDDPGQWSRLGLPEPAVADNDSLVGDLWVGSWIAAMAVGILVWGLIGYAVIRFRKRDEGVPAQTRYNIPIEVLYTVVPFIIIAVLSYFTFVNEHRLLNRADPAEEHIGVVGYQWSWLFNYTDANVYETPGTLNSPPTLYLPVDTEIEFTLSSPDVIHSFWVPAFYFKMDVIPGQQNRFQMEATEEGTFTGRCAEFCGTNHSDMLFTVKVVSEQEYAAHLRDLRSAGQTGVFDPGLRGSGGQQIDTTEWTLE